MEQLNWNLLCAHGESLTVEFKSDVHRPFGDDEIVEAVVCLANAEGGMLYIGIEDDGTVTGISERRREFSPQRVEAMIFNKTDPSIRTRAMYHTVNSKNVLSIEVPKAISIVATTGGKSVRRIIGPHGRPECIPFLPSQHAGRSIELGNLDYSSQSLPGTSLADVDNAAMIRLRRLIELKGELNFDAEVRDEEILIALQLMNWSKQADRCLNVAGLLLVGRSDSLARYIPTHQIAFQVFGEDTAVSVNAFSNEPLVSLLDRIEERFSAQNREMELELGLVRIGVPDYPPASFREGLLNAVIHRDYTRMGAIHVQMQDEQLAIFSPGGFPAGVTLQNLLVHEPVARNARLAEVCLRLGLVERAGRGIDRIFFQQLRYGRPAPDYGASDREGVRLVLPGGRPSLALVKLVFESEDRGSKLDLNALLVINELYRNRTVTTARVAELIQLGESRARAVIERLVESGLVVKGSSRGMYRLGLAAHVVDGSTAEYVRGRGFEPLQRVALIEQFVQVKGSISRSEVADLCRITSDEAKVVLRRMKAQGRLALVGARRTAYYIAGTNFGTSTKTLEQSQKIEAD